MSRAITWWRLWWDEAAGEIQQEVIQYGGRAPAVGLWMEFDLPSALGRGPGPDDEQYGMCDVVARSADWMSWEAPPAYEIGQTAPGAVRSQVLTPGGWVDAEAPR